MKWYNVWHDDGRYLTVRAANDRDATDIAMEEWRETDINVITVDNGD